MPDAASTALTVRPRTVEGFMYTLRTLPLSGYRYDLGTSGKTTVIQMYRMARAYVCHESNDECFMGDCKRCVVENAIRRSTMAYWTPWLASHLDATLYFIFAPAKGLIPERAPVFANPSRKVMWHDLSGWPKEWTVVGYYNGYGLTSPETEWTVRRSALAGALSRCGFVGIPTEMYRPECPRSVALNTMYAAKRWLAEPATTAKKSPTDVKLLDTAVRRVREWIEQNPLPAATDPTPW
jgi:hypothetical protein